MCSSQHLRWRPRLAWLAVAVPLISLPLPAEPFLLVPPLLPTGERLCPGVARVVIPFRTGPQITHVTRLVFPQVERPATGGWNSPTVFCGITADPDGFLEQTSQRFRYTPPEAGASVADVMMDRPYWVYIDTFDQPGGAGLAADTEYFIMLDFGDDVANGTHSGWCLPRGVPGSASGLYTLSPDQSGLVPAVTIEGVIHLPAPQRSYAAYDSGEGPNVAGVVWGQRGDGVTWTGAGNQARFNTPAKVSYGALFPPSPAVWRAIEATVEGPGVFNFGFSGPVLARGGREPDYAFCSLWIDGVLAQASIPAGGQTLSLGPGTHQLLWAPELGPSTMHMGGNDFVADFTLSNIHFGRGLSLADALDAEGTEWTPVGVWIPGASSLSEDWARSEFPYSATAVPCFHATVTGPGKLALNARLFVSYRDTQLWNHILEADWESRIQVSIDGRTEKNLATGIHEIDVGAGTHDIALSVLTISPSGAFPSNSGTFRAEFETLQYVPAQPSTFALWLAANNLPPTTPPADDADGNGVPAWMEWAAGLPPASELPLLSITCDASDLVLTASRNRSAAVDWRLEEMVLPGDWHDATSQFSTDFVTESKWRARRSRGDRPAALYRLMATPR